jgi:uncharacterized membrane protein (DUF485 family)
MRRRGPLRQKTLIGLGELYDSFVTSLPILSGIQFISILTILYADIKPHLLGLAPWMTLPYFFGIITALMVGTMVLVYKYLIPSVWNFRGNQMFKYDSEVRDKLDEVLRRLESLENRNNSSN